MRIKLYLTLFSVALIFSSADELFAQEVKESALKQIQSLIDEKESRTPAQQKINSQLLYALKMSRGQAISTEVATLNVNITKDAAGLALVDIKGTIDNALIKTINSLGGKILFSSEKFNIINAAIPLQALEPIASLVQVRSINMPLPPSHADKTKNKVTANSAGTPNLRNTIAELKNFKAGFDQRAEKVREKIMKALSDKKFSPFIGSVTSNGDVKHNAALARTNFGVNGTGIKIGILSDSYDTRSTGVNASDDVISGDLPGPGNPNGFTTPVTVLSDHAAGSDEGRAMLEIVHDLAPGAQLYFATAFNSEADFAQQILNLRAAGCDIICDDVFYYDEPVFQDGIVAQAVNTVTASGAIYFSSAGNQGNKNDNSASVWEGDFNDGGALALLPGGTLHNFSGGTLFNAMTTNGADRLFLFWADKFGASANDYDLFVLNSSSSAVITSSATTQNGTQDPIEFITAAQSSGNRIVIFKKTSAAPLALHFNIFGDGLTFSTNGQTHGHGSAAAAFSVAATQA